jgi:hypothetical protein
MDSLKYHYGPPWLTIPCPAGGPPLKQPYGRLFPLVFFFAAFFLFNFSLCWDLLWISGRETYRGCHSFLAILFCCWGIRMLMFNC